MLRGGELVSNNLYGYGSYSACMKLPNAPASITGFFLYQPPDYASEIDLEIYNDPSHHVGPCEVGSYWVLRGPGYGT